MLSYAVKESHLQKEVDPGEGDGDSTDLPLQAGSLLPDEMMESHEERESVDKGIKEEDGRQVRRPFPMEYLQLAEDWLVLLAHKEEHKPGGVQHEEGVPEAFVAMCKPVVMVYTLFLVV